MQRAQGGRKWSEYKRCVSSKTAELEASMPM